MVFFTYLDGFADLVGVGQTEIPILAFGFGGKMPNFKVPGG